MRVFGCAHAVGPLPAASLRVGVGVGVGVGWACSGLLAMLRKSRPNWQWWLTGGYWLAGVLMLDAVEWHTKLSHFEENLHPNLSQPSRLCCSIFRHGCCCLSDL